MKRTYRILADEFALANFQLQMGRPRAEVLHELGVRTGVSDLRALAAVLIQADRFGSSVAQALQHAKRLDAHPPPPTCRRKGRQNGRATDLSRWCCSSSRASSWFWSARRPLP